MASSSYATTFPVQVKNVTIDTTVADTVQLWILPLNNWEPCELPSPRKWSDWTANGGPMTNIGNALTKSPHCSFALRTTALSSNLEYIPTSLRSFLSDPEFIFVGARFEEAAQKLRLDYGLSVYSTTDIVELTVSKGYGKRYKSTLGLKNSS